MKFLAQSLKILLAAGLAALLAACATPGADDDESAALANAVETAPEPEPEPEPEPVVEEPKDRRELVSLAVYAGSDRVFFDYDSAELSDEGRVILGRQADWMKFNSDATFLVEGHCDERGTRDYNLALGERRATAVKNYLVALGVDSDRINTVSYGKERPIDPRSTAEAWAKNRRGVTTVSSPGV